MAARAHPSCPVAVSRCRAHPSCPVAVGRDVPIAPPRHRRGAYLCIPRPRRRAASPAVRGFASRAPARAPVPRCRAHPSCGIAVHTPRAASPCASLVRLGGRARCPHRAAALSAVRGLASRAPLPCAPPVRTPPVPRCPCAVARAPWYGARLAADGDDRTPRPARL